jgi:hypothetical protein
LKNGVQFSLTKFIFQLKKKLITMSIRKGRKERGSREEGKTEVRKKYESLGRESNIFEVSHLFPQSGCSFHLLGETRLINCITF